MLSDEFESRAQATVLTNFPVVAFNPLPMYNWRPSNDDLLLESQILSQFSA